MTIGAGGLTQFYARSITGGDWAIAGPVGHLTAALSAEVSDHGPLHQHHLFGRRAVGGDRNHGSINSISAATLVNSTISAGVGPLPGGEVLPQASSDFTNPGARIGSISLSGAPLTDSFVNDAIAAPTLGTLHFALVEFANNGMVQGLAAQSIAAFSGVDSVTRRAFLAGSSGFNQRADVPSY